MTQKNSTNVNAPVVLTTISAFREGSGFFNVTEEVFDGTTLTRSSYQDYNASLNPLVTPDFAIPLNTSETWTKIIFVNGLDSTGNTVPFVTLNYAEEAILNCVVSVKAIMSDEMFVSWLEDDLNTLSGSFCYVYETQTFCRIISC
jgi:hypothetical protein